MTKRIKIISMVLAITAVLVVALVACTPAFTPLTGGAPDANSESNHGYVVKQGEYYYFINGYTSAKDIKEKKDNTHGKVLKGAIMRAKKNAEGKFDQNAGEVVVPLMVTSTNMDQGFSIFGEWLYYTTPSVKTDSYGTIQTGYLEFNRCKITGADTQNIATLKAETVTKYKFTPESLIYVEDNALKRVDYGKKTVSTIAEKTTAQVFPVGETYVNGKVAPDNYVYYTVAPEEANGEYNEMYAVTGMADPKKLVGKGTFGEGVKISVSPKYVATEPDGQVVLYYDKSSNSTGAAVSMGLFGIKLGNQELTEFNKDNEKHFTLASDISVMPYLFDEGMLVDSGDGESKYFYFSNIDENGRVSGIDKKYRYPSAFALGIYKIITENEKKMLYYTAGTSLYKIEMSDGGFNENTVKLITANAKLDWLELERIGDDFFIMNAKYYNYIYVFNIAALDGVESNVGLSRKDMTLLGKMIDTDKENYDKLIEEEDKEDK